MSLELPTKKNHVSSPLRLVTKELNVERKIMNNEDLIAENKSLQETVS